MPVDTGLNKDGMIYQRERYAEGGISVRYWDYRDSVAFRYVVGSDILDAGCGEGITLDKLTKLFPECRIVGIDSEPENIEICRRYQLPVLEGSIYELPFADASIDTILFSEVIEHLDTPKKALSEIYRVLRPKGRVIIIFPNDRTCMLARLTMGMFREALYDSGHVCQWTPAKISKALIFEGFTQIVAMSIPLLSWHLSLHHVCVGEKDISNVKL